MIYRRSIAMRIVCAMWLPFGGLGVLAPIGLAAASARYPRVWLITITVVAGSVILWSRAWRVALVISTDLLIIKNMFSTFEIGPQSVSKLAKAKLVPGIVFVEKGWTIQRKEGVIPIQASLYIGTQAKADMDRQLRKWGRRNSVAVDNA